MKCVIAYRKPTKNQWSLKCQHCVSKFHPGGKNTCNIQSLKIIIIIKETIRFVFRNILKILIYAYKKSLTESSL